MGKIEHINPPGFPAQGFTNVVVVTGNVKTVYIGGQNGVNSAGEMVGKDDLTAQVAQIFENLQIALEAGGAKLEHVIKWTILVVHGQDVRPAFGVFQQVWGLRPNPPAITVAFVSALARPDALAELEAIAVVPE